jgi:ankyrin repeat protein
MEWKYKSYGRQALCQVIQTQIPEILEALLKHDIDPKLPMPVSSFEFPPLVFAAQYKNIDIIRLLINYGGDVNAPRPPGAQYGETPLKRAISNSNSMEVLQFLLNNGAKIIETPDYPSELYMATEANKPEIVQLFLQHGAKIDVTKERYNCIHSAVNKNPSILYLFKNALEKEKREEIEKIVFWLLK